MKYYLSPSVSPESVQPDLYRFSTSFLIGFSETGTQCGDSREIFRSSPVSTVPSRVGGGGGGGWGRSRQTVIRYPDYNGACVCLLATYF